MKSTPLAIRDIGIFIDSNANDNLNSPAKLKAANRSVYANRPSFFLRRAMHALAAAKAKLFLALCALSFFLFLTSKLTSFMGWIPFHHSSLSSPSRSFFSFLFFCDEFYWFFVIWVLLMDWFYWCYWLFCCLFFFWIVLLQVIIFMDSILDLLVIVLEMKAWFLIEDNVWFCWVFGFFVWLFVLSDFWLRVLIILLSVFLLDCSIAKLLSFMNSILDLLVLLLESVL